MNNPETKKDTSRRDWYAGSAAALLGAGAVSSILLRAQTTSTTTNDISILNYALRLENLESAFYSQGLATFAPKAKIIHSWTPRQDDRQGHDQRDWREDALRQLGNPKDKDYQPVTERQFNQIA